MFLCDLDDLPKHGTREFTLNRQDLFMLRQNDQIWAYLNYCPHMGITLNWVVDQFLDTSGQYIQCANHGALFRFEDGLCIAGPCIGQYLKPISYKLIDNKIDIILPIDNPA
ncbi:Rieske (2Fe-2S) domain-containing protein [Candidatus Nitrosoglobus terrae]|uniref:Rieske (2Fe-2S) domain-containing protein n=1 Tax=Candidatus Nitrosoglobus terrae TaxID=1630141 RepID=A0A1Q2SKG4_9GAMM|nr:Rieske 2Fe-2S domain-containing protein [Candidatus Nitrosoglobus terrae]BAW79610.1 Rieske (2Fe-2S) domain-containing protein [Candidatus Nitrosoglobus terrae]